MYLFWYFHKMFTSECSIILTSGQMSFLNRETKWKLLFKRTERNVYLTKGFVLNKSFPVNFVICIPQ